VTAKKILVTGAGGMLGSDVLAFCNRRAEEGHYKVLGITRRECDLESRKALQTTLSRIQPDVIIHCAAFTDVDGCESQKEKAWRVNRDVVENIAKWVNGSGARLFYVSTDYVFDGTKDLPYNEEDPVCPINVYGRSKQGGEMAVSMLMERGATVRTSWLFGSGGGNFVKSILRRARSGGRLKVVTDQRGSPTYTVDLAEGIFHLVQSGASGTYHLCNSGSCTWFEFAREILTQAGMGDLPMNKITSEELARPARRPQNSVLSCEKYHTRTGKTLRPWKDALRAYLHASPSQD